MRMNVGMSMSTFDLRRGAGAVASIAARSHGAQRTEWTQGAVASMGGRAAARVRLSGAVGGHGRNVSSVLVHRGHGQWRGCGLSAGLRAPCGIVHSLNTLRDRKDRTTYVAGLWNEIFCP